jgi:hypothetical protein
MTFKFVEMKHPEHRASAQATVDWATEQLQDALHALLPAGATEDEIMAWVKRTHDRCFNEYMDWLSVL